MRFLGAQAEHIHDRQLRTATLDILKNPKTCVMHRRGLAAAQAQDAVIQTPFDQGLVHRADAAAFPAGRARGELSADPSSRCQLAPTAAVARIGAGQHLRRPPLLSGRGGHHILSVAESMARGLPQLMVVTQASAHSAPTLGNEFRVVNTLRAAANIARASSR
jgi:hypothetical protein